MSCRAMRERVQAYSDGELGVEGAIEVEAHLAGCSACRDAFESQRAFRHMVGALYPQEAPPDLERRIAAALRPPSRRWPLLASGIAAAALVAGLVGLLTRGSEAALPSEVRAALEVHRTAEHGGAPLGLASHDAGEINRWLRREAPFFADLPSPQTSGFVLHGAGMVELAGTRAAYVLYDGTSGPVSLFVLPRHAWPAMGRPLRSGTVEFRWIEAGGHRVLAWTHDPVSYLLVSDAALAPSQTCAVCHTGTGGAADPRTNILPGENPS
jgi:anti-sigma factor RsiW